jgi:hypothetical protein
MIGKGLLTILIVATIAAVSSCNDDDEGLTEPTSKYKNLSQRDHVLINLEFSYEERNLDRFVELLDDDFIFHFSADDFRDGNVSVKKWARANEVTATTNLFDPEYQGPREPVSGIELSLTYADSDTSWREVTPEDQKTYPGETWYEKTVLYSLAVTVPVGPAYITYVSEYVSAAFTVRWGEADGGWRIIAWCDDTEYSLFRRAAGTRDTESFTKETTWGEIKTLYAE